MCAKNFYLRVMRILYSKVHFTNTGIQIFLCQTREKGAECALTVPLWTPSNEQLQLQFMQKGAEKKSWLVINHSL
jgi:hypothetical protein